MADYLNVILFIIHSHQMEKKRRVQTARQPLKIDAIWQKPLNLIFDLMSIANVDPLCLCIVGKSNYVAATKDKTQ